MSDEPELTMNSWPVSEFSGRPPSPGALKRGSRHVPVHVHRIGRRVEVRVLVAS